MSTPSDQHQPSSEPKLDGIWISDTAIRQPVFVTMIMFAIVVVGLLSFFTMPVNLLPEINPPVISVVIGYPGAGPESVADQIARPFEEAISTLNGVSSITTNSSEGRMVAIVEFVQERDPIQALQDVREKVSQVRGTFPSEIDDPIFNRFDPSQAPIISLAVVADDDLNPQELRELIDDEIVPRLQRVQGVGSIDVTGGLVRQINVLMDLNRLTALQILPAQISQAIATANNNQGLGNIGVDGVDVNLRTPSVIQQPDDILRVGLPGTTYKIGDVARVEDGFDDIDQYTRLNGSDAIQIDIRKQSGTNTVAVADAVFKELDRAFGEFPQLRYTIVRDDAETVRLNVRGALEEILFAIVGAVLVLFLFLRDIRNTFTMVAGLPVIIIGTFAALAAFDQTINILSLLALSISVGLVIDDAIVVRENIIRRVEAGEPPLLAASRGTAEVSLSVLAMTLTIVAVFVPVTFTTGVVGIIFGAFGITVASAILISLFEAFTLAPMLSSVLFRGNSKKQAKREPKRNHTPEFEDERIPADMRGEHIDWMGRTYGRMLAFSLRHRFVTLSLGVLVIFLTVSTAQNVKFAFFPSQDEHQFGMGFTLPPGTPLEITDQLARQAEQILLRDPDVEAVLVNVGGTGTSEQAEFFVKLHEEASTPVVQARLRPQLAQFPDMVMSIASFQGTSTEVTNRPLQAKILTTGSLEEIIPIAETAVARFRTIPGLEDVAMTYRQGKPEIQFRLDPARAADFNFSNSDLSRTLRALIDGDKAAIYREDGSDYDIVVRLQPEDRSDINSISTLRVPINGQLVPLANVATLAIAESPTSLRREDRQVAIIIGGNNVGRNINEVQADMQAVLDELDLPPGVVVAFGGDTADQGEGFASLLVAMLLSVIFVYMVLASQFGSFFQPFVIMLAMPLSFVGAFAALSLTQVELTIFGMVGMIMLMGLVVKNSILLVDFSNRLLKAGIEKNIAIQLAGAVRLRPILMTSLTLILGAMPSAIGLGDGGEARRGLAMVIIGGMITSTLLTLILVPSAYSLLESVTRRVNNFWHWLGQRGQTTQPALSPALATASGNTTLSTTSHAELAYTNGQPSGNGTHHAHQPSNGSAPVSADTAPDSNTSNGSNGTPNESPAVVTAAPTLDAGSTQNPDQPHQA